MWQQGQGSHGNQRRERSKRGMEGTDRLRGRGPGLVQCVGLAAQWAGRTIGAGRGGPEPFPLPVLPVKTQRGLPGRPKILQDDTGPAGPVELRPC